ncbi:DEAD/DEAH box helicase family protein [Patescibacteria group bacterium]|nr:AAA family ATPase [Candidatus Falkowbacteria bacterium]MBU3906219.1 DEAD/DEAH box helicase family protein [Patescibacteria group bacterium]MCG2698433.1 phospholipase D-like domain-containing protein [Candidatus Parcubacteria bacterium]MBU4015377.1 DEAD/DEAH box helicase family protein [Patescibacteria group bacterium]MBU4026814.1 DEAD/DEAH box helicase family protein [Patescibacteria group bacterium]
MSNFITNSGAENLKKRLIELIDKSEELKFLVGFFYFSGIRELYQGLKDNPDVKIKVLVGLNVDKSNYGLLEYGDPEKQLSDAERCYKFFESIKKSLNTENFDTKDFYEQVKYFIKLIREDKLIIRKTYNPNHAKVYIFKLQEGQVGRKNLFITGSSNLTNAGLSTQEEFNVEISDYGFEDTEKYFDKLWEEAIKITENDITKKRLIEVVEGETLIKEITPFEAYVLVLQTYFDSFEQKEIGESLVKTLENNGYTPYRYQLDAVSQALSIIEKNNGVIIADVVGLGKTIIACAVAKEMKKRGVIICPPGLVGDKNKNSGWKKYAEEFGMYDWETRSLGDLENIAEFVQKTKDIEVIIIDEAHRFRNQDTKDYEYLKNICRDKIVILLTATPFNNRPGDILSLLKLFITPKKSSITLENNLVARFQAFKGIFDRLGYIKKYWKSAEETKRRKALAYYEGLFEEKDIKLERIKQRSKYLAKQIRDVIEPVTIRRNRLDLQNNPHYKDEVKNLSKVADPKEWFYKLTKEQSDFYDKIISVYFGDPDEGGQFKGVIYRPFEYEVEKEKINNEKLTEKENFQLIQQRNLYDFMRRLMVKRFESSFGSFRQSIKNFKKITETAQEFINKTGKYILDRALMEDIYDKDPEEIENYLNEYSEKIKNGEYPKNHKIYTLKDFKYKDEFIAHIEADLKLFDKILQDLEELDLIKNDPKTDCLLNNLEAVLKEKPNKKEPKRKIIVFSEYLDTVKYLEPILREHFGERLLFIAGDLSAKKVFSINKNFDASYDSQENEFDVLLSTDKISEGFNLNRAGMVVNYDIPWNPVRVIQRVGRINRISKKVFDELYIVNFFPTEKGAELVKSREIASNKMFLIHSTLGEDAKIFDIDEEPTPAGLYGKVQQNPDKLEEESFYTKMLAIYEKIKKEKPELIEALKKYPPRIKAAKKYGENELLVFLKKGQLYVHSVKYGEDGKDQIFPTTLEDVFNNIICDEEEKLLKFSDRAWDAYENIKNFKEYRVSPISEQSLEQMAIINLKFLINTVQREEIMPYKDFLRTVLEDVIDYGTLSDYTLRRIANLESGDDKKIKTAIKEIEAIEKELGGAEYLQKEKDRQKDLSKEIIIAIENQKLK